MNIFQRLQTIDRRILYILLAVVVAVPLLMRPSTHPSVIFDEVRGAFNTLNNIPKDKIVLISTVWSAGTEAENGPQTEAIMRHLFKNGTKFAVVSWDPVGSKMTYDIGAKLEKELGKQYGTDWVHLGYIPGTSYTIMISVISGMGKDFKGQFKTDRAGTSLYRIPCLKNVNDHRQIAAAVEITPSGTLETWIAWFATKHNVPLVYCPTAVMAAEAYKFLDSKQIAGMLNGVIGAAQYETLLGMGNQRTYAARSSWALSCAHIYIILLIVLGNVGYILSRRATQGRQR